MHGQGREFYSCACSDQGWEYLHAWSREGDASTGQGFTHVRRVLRPRVGISACMVTGGGVLLMLGASTGQGLFWGRVYLGYLHAWPGKGVLLMLGACSDQGWDYLQTKGYFMGISACMVTGGGVLLMLGASTGQGLFWGRVYLGYLHAWPGKGVLLMVGASSDQGWE